MISGVGTRIRTHILSSADFRSELSQILLENQCSYRLTSARSTHETQQFEIQLKKVMAERTGLEPATPGVTGRYSNQLNYRSR